METWKLPPTYPQTTKCIPQQKQADLPMAEENFEGEAQIIKDHMEEAKRIMKLYPLMDGHNDLPWGLRNCFENKWSKLDLTKNWSGVRVDGVPWEQLHTDIPRLKEGCVGGEKIIVQRIAMVSPLGEFFRE